MVTGVAWSWTSVRAQRGTGVPAISRAFSGQRSPAVLELRIHGVSNTPPAAMLDLRPDEIEQVDGDALAAFWSPTSAAAAAGARLPRDHRNYLPRGVHREAYSWGLLARTTPDGAVRLLGVVVAAVIRLGWALVIPFGLANVAYWSRSMRPQPADRRGWRHAHGAAGLRVFALALTLLYATSASAVSLDLVAVQCFGTVDGVGVARCSQLPAVMTELATWDRGQRLAVAALVPVLALLALFWLSQSARVRFDDQISPSAAHAPVRTSPGSPASWVAGPLLAVDGFWHKRRLAISSARLHLAAGLCLVTLCLAWDQVFAQRRGCDEPGTMFGPVCRASLASPWTADAVVVAGLGVLAAALLALVVGRACVGVESGVDVSWTHQRDRASWSGWLLLVSVVVFVGVAVLLAVPWTREPPRATSKTMLGLVAAPTVVIAVLLGLALAALGWRRGLRSVAWLTLLAVGGGSLLLASLWPRSTGATGAAGGGSFLRAGALVVAGLALGLLLLAVRRSGRRRPTGVVGSDARGPAGNPGEAWSGMGPGVFMLLSAGAAMVLSGLLVAGAAAWLNAPAGAPVVTVPDAYREFGAATVVALVVLLGVLGWVAGVRRGLYYLAPAPCSVPAPIAGSHYVGRHPERPPAVDVHDPPAGVGPMSEGALKVLRGRRLAAYSQLAEPLVGWLAAAMAFALLATIAISGRLAPWDWLASAGTWVLGALALVIVADAVASASPGTVRPLGLVWDLMCFLPRAAHPFGPPSYAERAVPELRARVERWFEANPGGRVVLSAHSLGSVLAVACLLARPEESPSRPRIGLVTYGSQLRPYFGRFFPELLGPDIVGTAMCARPRVRDRDPWRTEVGVPPPDALPGMAGVADTVVRRLGGRAGSQDRLPAWLNLWRRTDYLGFPAASYGENPVDRGAEEVDRTGYLFTVAAHAGYPRALVYHDAVAEVLRRMSQSTP